MLGLGLKLSYSSGLALAGDLIIAPDIGYVFLYTPDGRPVYNHLNQPVQVPIEFANS